MLYRVANLIHKELLQISRDTILVVFLIVGPVTQLSLLAWNTSEGVKHLPMAVLDMDRSSNSRELIALMDNTEELDLTHYADDLQEVYRMIETGQAKVAVIIPPNFAADLKGLTRPPQLQIVADGTNTIAAKIGLSAIEGAVARYTRGLFAFASVKSAAIDLRADVRFNPTLNSRDYSIPAQVGMIAYQVTLTIASLGLTRERETGTLEQLIIMPLRRLELIVGKAAPPLMITMADFALMLLIATRAFHVPMQGSLGLLFALTALFATAEIGWGLFLSTIARTQQQAVLFVFVQAMLDMAFSGFLVPVENLPRVLQFVSAVIPLRHYLVIMRGVMLKGGGLDVLWPQALALAGLSLGVGIIGVMNIGRRLD